MDMMGKLTWLCVLLMAVLDVAVTGATLPIMYVIDGDSLTLAVPLDPKVTITGIVWTHNGKPLAERVNNVLWWYSDIKERAAINTSTGQLIINNANSWLDTGEYKVEINDVESKKYQVRVIKKVQKPKVIASISESDSNKCVFMCESDTTDAGHITYSWKKGDGEWTVSGKDITITNYSGVETCRIKNPVSEEESDPETIPLCITPIPSDTATPSVISPPATKPPGTSSATKPKAGVKSATVISSTVPAVLISSVVFLHLYNW